MQGRHHVRARTAHVGAQLTASASEKIIGIDGSRATLGRLTGTERYSVEILAALAELDSTDRFRVYLNAGEAPVGLRFPGEAIAIPGPRFWTLRNLALQMRREPPDLLFVPSYVIPPIHPPAVVTIHDLGYLVEPGCHDPIHRKQLEWSTRWNVSVSSGIIAISETTKTDLIERLDADPDKIRVIYHGISESMHPATPAEIDSIRARYGVGERSILSVGTIQPRKNLVRLIQAFELLAADDGDLQLVLCGTPGWKSDDILGRLHASPFRERIVHIGYVPDADLPALYSASSVFAFPSLYEGFGMPALEAMACGTPVVAANRAALPEICGDVAVLVEPLDSHDIANGMHRLLTDEGLRRDSIQLGLDRAQSFRWHDCAVQTLAFLHAIGDT